MADQRYILEPGVFVAQSEGPANPALQEIAALWGCDPEQDSFHLMAECSALITYLNPTRHGPEYVRSVLARGHASIAGQSFVTLGLFGIPLETLMELLAHGLDSTARLTSSAVVAMDDPLFCLFGPEELRPLQIKAVERQLALRAELEPEWKAASLSATARRELQNSFWPSNRAVFLFMGMRLIDWDKLLKKRLPRGGNEAMLRVVCRLIGQCLRLRYPEVILDPDGYGWDGDPWR